MTRPVETNWCGALTVPNRTNSLTVRRMSFFGNSRRLATPNRFCRTAFLRWVLDRTGKPARYDTEFSQDGQQEGGFTATVWSNNTDKLAPVDGRRLILEDVGPVSSDRDVLNLEKRSIHACSALHVVRTWMTLRFRCFRFKRSLGPKSSGYQPLRHQQTEQAGLACSFQGPPFSSTRGSHRRSQRIEPFLVHHGQEWQDRRAGHRVHRLDGDAGFVKRTEWMQGVYSST